MVASSRIFESDNPQDMRPGVSTQVWFEYFQYVLYWEIQYSGSSFIAMLLIHPKPDRYACPKGLSKSSTVQPAFLVFGIDPFPQTPCDAKKMEFPSLSSKSSHASQENGS